MIDFGDAAWSHPILSMIMMIIECRCRWSVPDLPDALNLDHPVLHRIIDGYLEAWSGYASIDELRWTMSDALRVAPLRRAQAWLANLAEADGEALAEHGQLPWLWLQDVTVPVSGLVRTG